MTDDFTVFPVSRDISLRALTFEFLTSNRPAKNNGRKGIFWTKKPSLFQTNKDYPSMLPPFISTSASLKSRIDFDSERTSLPTYNQNSSLLHLSTRLFKGIIDSVQHQMFLPRKRQNAKYIWLFFFFFDHMLDERGFTTAEIRHASNHQRVLFVKRCGRCCSLFPKSAASYSTRRAWTLNVPGIF